MVDPTIVPSGFYNVQVNIKAGHVYQPEESGACGYCGGSESEYA